MRILIRYQQQFGNFTTKAVDLDIKEGLAAIQQQILKKFQVPLDKQLIKVLKDGNPVRLTDAFCLEFFEITNQSIIYLEYIQSQKEIKRSEQKRINSNFYHKLGIERLNTIREEESAHSYRNDSELNFQNSPVDISDDHKNQQWTVSTNMYESCNYEEKKKIDELLKTTQYGKLKEIKEMIDNDDSNLINQQGNNGWNALHFAIFCNHHSIVQFYLKQESIDINQPTLDHWTPLMLAIHRNNIDIVKLLLDNQNIDINRTTIKGSALHIAVKNQNLEIVQHLISKNIDPLLNDESDNKALDYCKNMVIKQIIIQKINISNLQKNKDCQKQLQIVQKLQLPQIHGHVYKLNSFLLKTNKRFLALNPQDGNLYRYKNQEQYPLDYIEIIHLKDITDVRRIFGKFYMKKKFHYFEINCNQKQIYCCKNQKTADQWVEFIFKSMVYVNYIENQINNEFIMDVVRKNESKMEMLNDLDDQVLEISQQHHSNIQKQKQLMQQEDNESHVNFDSFRLLKEIGNGAFGKVFLVEKKDNKKLYAMKALRKHNLLINNQLKYAVSEANILKNANNPFILEIYYCFQTPRYLYLIIEYCQGNDLGFHLARNYTFSEEQARFYISELLLAVEYLHQQDIVYRDLKPENILLSNDGHIKLADFGLSKQGIKDNQTAQSFCGSPAYLAPELLNNKGSGKTADLYGIGAVLYEMLIGLPPYYDDDIPTMYKRIKQGRLKFTDDVSECAQDLIRQLLNKNPKQRLGAKSKDEIKGHPFFKDVDWQKLMQKETTPPDLFVEDKSYIEEELKQIQKYPQMVRFNDKDYNQLNQKVNRVINFSFRRPSVK